MERTYNQTLVFNGTPAVKDMEEALKKMERLNLSKTIRSVFITILNFLFNVDANRILSADEICLELGKIDNLPEKYLDSRHVMTLLSDMAKAGLIREGVVMTAFVKPRGPASSPKSFDYFCEVEQQMLQLMEEMAPDAGIHQDRPDIFNLRLMSQRLKDCGFDRINTDVVERILRSMANDRGTSLGKSLKITGRQGMDQLWVYVKFSWEKIRQRVDLRHRASRVILETLITGLPVNLRAGQAEVLAEFFITDIMEAMGRDLFLSGFKGDIRSLIERGLLCLHDVKVITLQNGLGVFRQAYSLTLLPESRSRQYTKGDYEPLSHHYDQKNVQVHVMEKFARLGLEKIKTALTFVSDYFSSSCDAFITQYFPNEKKIIHTAMTYHGFAMRLTGRSFLESRSLGQSVNFDGIIDEAIDLLSGEKWIAGIDPSEAREYHLAGFRYVLVDEYQDIDQRQYAFISALTGRLEQDIDTRISIMAVGDDDQSIYGFRNANITFIKRFQQEYDAKTFYLMENYRSSPPIIETSASFIAQNENRMKKGQPSRINRKRNRGKRANPVEKTALVQIVHAQDLSSQAVFVAEAIKKILKQNPEARPGDIAVVSRQGISYPPLVALRMVLAKGEIDFCYSIKNAAGFPLFQVREIQRLMQFLDRNLRRSLAPRILIREVMALFEQENIWTNQIKEILDIWSQINRDMEISIGRAKDFVLETLLEERREHKTGNGVFIGTVHSVKGMEFSFVFILDGGWKEMDMEEERRLFYVGMTRAKDGLVLFNLTSSSNPHNRFLTHHGSLHESAAGSANIKGFSDDLTVSVLGLADIYLDYPGLFRPTHKIHKHLAALETGAKVRLEKQNDRVYILDDAGRLIASLSKKGSARWQDHLHTILTAKVLGIVCRYAPENNETDFKKVKLSSWELPMVEILHVKSGKVC